MNENDPQLEISPLDRVALVFEDRLIAFDNCIDFDELALAVLESLSKPTATSAAMSGD